MGQKVINGSKRQKIEREQSPAEAPNNLLPHFSSPHYPSSYGKKRIAKSLLPELNELQKLNSSYEVDVEACKSIVHIFTRDFRINDNISLSEASHRAAELGKPLICIYIDYPQLDRVHSVSGWQREYRKQALLKLQAALETDYKIPLYFSSCEETSGPKILDHLLSILAKVESTTVYSNILYEIDELKLCLHMLKELPKHGISFNAFHDFCVIGPDHIRTKKDSPYSVFTPWYKSWLKYLNDNKTEILRDVKVIKPPKNENTDPLLKKFFNSTFEEKVSKKELDDSDHTQQRENFKKYWNAGEDSALKDLNSFIKSGKISSYGKNRDSVEPIETSQLSVHISSGAISVRTILRILHSKIPKLFNFDHKGNEGESSWIRQLAWRDFYTHILCHWPYVCTFLPFQTDFASIQWEYNKDHFTKWCKGETGYPFVDAAMRQLNQTGYMHNRCRMVVASFLSKHLLIDWRYGERYFLEHLVDGDFASNNGGWGFSSSVGVDPQPYFRIFNPWTQSEKFGANGEYIRKWVPELRHIKDKSIHNPYASHETVDDYPRPIVDHKESRERALERYKQAKYD